MIPIKNIISLINYAYDKGLFVLHGSYDNTSHISASVLINSEYADYLFAAVIIQLLIILFFSYRFYRNRNKIQSIERAKARLNIILDVMQEMFFQVGIDGAIHSFSISRNSGLIEDTNLQGKNLKEIFPFEIARKLTISAREAIISGQNNLVEFDIQSKQDGAFYECRIVPYGQEEALLVLKDITKRAQAIKMLEEKEQLNSLLVETMNDGLAVQSTDYRLIFVNKRFCEMLGYSLEELVGRYTHEFIEPGFKERWNNHIEKRKMGLRESYELAWKTKDGRKLVTILSAAPITDSKGGFKGSFAIISDISRLKQNEEDKQVLEEKLFHYEKMESIGRLAGGIAHDFNNILTAVMGYAEMLKLKFGNAKTTEAKAISAIYAGTEKAAHLTKQLLDFARGGNYCPVPLNLNNEVKEVVRISEKLFNKDIEIKYDFDENLDTIEIDENQLNQVLTNLIINAKDAMPDGGEIAIKTENIYIDKDFVGRYPNLKTGYHVRLSITDNGIGIPKEIRDKIFEPFYTTKKSGTGLGLANVYSIITKHKGYINVYSEHGVGTTFKIYLPVSGKEAMKKAPEEKIYGGKETILLIDDEEAVRELTKLQLEMIGYKIIVAVDGEDGLDVYKSMQQEIDLILLDMIMPNMNGREAFNELISIDPSVKVLLISGFSKDHKVLEILNNGAKGFLQKPFKLSELSVTIHNALDN